MTDEQRDDETSSEHRDSDTPSDHQDDETADEHRDSEEVLAALGDLEGWRIENDAARVHYRGATDRYSIEYYHPSECVLYWKVPPEEMDTTAVPVGRNTVPVPLRERVREDLASADIDPELERQTL